MDSFQLVTEFQPTGDQPEAIARLVEGVRRGYRHQVLKGATGTGKTFTVANVIAQVQKPTLVLAHNKTLAAQLYAEFRELFPNNAVEYFVSYYDYYQPEAYVPQYDLYIEKDADVNEAIAAGCHSSGPDTTGHHRRGLRLCHLRPGQSPGMGPCDPALAGGPGDSP